MADSKQLQQIVERAVAQVLDREVPKLRTELVERVLGDLPAATIPTASGGSATDERWSTVVTVLDMRKL